MQIKQRSGGSTAGRKDTTYIAPTKKRYPSRSKAAASLGLLPDEPCGASKGAAAGSDKRSSKGAAADAAAGGSQGAAKAKAESKKAADGQAKAAKLGKEKGLSELPVKCPHGVAVTWCGAGFCRRAWLCLPGVARCPAMALRALLLSCRRLLSKHKQELVTAC